MQQQFPERNNFYASFNRVNKGKIAEIFANNGWLLRKSSWTDFELRNDWSDLILQGEEENPLMNGVIIYNETNIEKMDATLAMMGGQYVYEFYDESENLLFRSPR